MSKFIETDLGKEMFDTLVRAVQLHDDSITDDERLVREQKTKLYKLYCKVMYGHLFKTGKCIRCGESKN